MDKLIINGGNKLSGEIFVSGSKNAALPILASSILSNKKIILNNLPNVKDIKTMLLLLKSLGSIIGDNKKVITIKNNKQVKSFAL